MSNFMKNPSNDQGQKPPISVLSQAVYPEIARILNQLAAVITSWNPVELFTAVNYAGAKKRFIDDFRYGNPQNPIFEYNQSHLMSVTKAKGSLNALLMQLEVLPNAGTAEEELYKTLTMDLIRDSLSTVDMATGIMSGKDSATKEAVTEKYGLPTNETSLLAISLHETAVAERNKPHEQRLFVNCDGNLPTHVISTKTLI